LFSLDIHAANLSAMDAQEKIISIPVLSGEAFDALPESIRSYVRYLESTIQQLQIRVHELEDRLSKNSSNSSKPPSSDGLKKKPKSLRKPSGKKPGGQQGHIGKGLVQVSHPDLIVTHMPSNCTGCGSDLSSVGGIIAEQRQVFDIPQPIINVTEHRIEEKKCPCCSKLSKASFPENIKGPVQYGNRIRSLITYFSHQHFIPIGRVCEIFEDIFGVAISPGTCANIDEQLFANLNEFEAGLKGYLLAEKVLHFDETGMRCEKKLHWVHVASSQMATFYMMHTKRGQEAMDVAGILPHFQGTGVHDHWRPYFTYNQFKHGLCNAHHLRELTFIYEQKQEDWAKRMHDLLIQANQEVEKHAECKVLPPDVLLQIEQTYSQILTEGFAYHASLTPLSVGKRGKPRQRDGKNLLDRLQEKRDCVLRFIHDSSVPFTNNQGEQDIRMVKLKQKISGCFRAFHSSEIFCRVRSYISTARKQGWSIWDSLADAIRGSPRLLDAHQNISQQMLVV
jgi:transposase